jgi:hypothetical protein
VTVELPAKVSPANNDLFALIKRCDKEKPKQEDLDLLRKELEKRPALADEIGNLANMVGHSIIKTAFPAKLYALSVEMHCDHMRKELGHEDGTQAEKMLIEHIITCWLRVQDVELRYEMIRKDNPTINQMDHWERRLTLAQHRYLKAIETLAKVRRLMKEPVRPNVAFNLLLKQQMGGGQ